MARGDDGIRKEGGGFKLFGVEINLGHEIQNKPSSAFESVKVQKKRIHEDVGDDDRLRKSKSLGNLHEMSNQSGGGGDGDCGGDGGDGAGDGAGGDGTGYHSDGELHLSSRRAAHMRRKGIKIFRFE